MSALLSGLIPARSVKIAASAPFVDKNLCLRTAVTIRAEVMLERLHDGVFERGAFIADDLVRALTPSKQGVCDALSNRTSPDPAQLEAFARWVLSGDFSTAEVGSRARRALGLEDGVDVTDTKPTWTTGGLTP